MDVWHELGLDCLGGCSADALAPGNAHAGGTSPEGAEDEVLLACRIPGRDVEAHPVDVRQGLAKERGDVREAKERGDVREGGQPSGRSLRERLYLLGEKLVVCLACIVHGSGSFREENEGCGAISSR